MFFPVCLAITMSICGCVRSPAPGGSADGLMYAGKGRAEILFNSDWLFHPGEITGGQDAMLDDADWRIVNLPHDWSVEDLPGKDSPFDSLAIGGIDYGYLTGGTAWYRKKFTMPGNARGKNVTIYFEGVYMNSDTWINGKHLGNHPYGYTGYEYDITEYLDFENENVIAVEVKNEGRSSRWYPGSGIYRHVWLKVREPVHVATWGTYITTPQVNQAAAVVTAENKIRNTGGTPVQLEISTSILDASGKAIASAKSETQIPANSNRIVSRDINVKNPDLWSTGSPYLYTALTEVKENGALRDRVETKFGIRTLEFSIDGFYLNGENILLKGGCMHHDNGPLGAAAFDRAEERRVELMKANGFNAIRISHNPPSSAFLDACDRLGLLVINEAFDMWRYAKRPRDYHLYFDTWWKKDIEAMVLRDRNHPSIIMWSTGNEIPERGRPEGVETSIMLRDYVRSLDATRPVTAAVNGLTPDKDPYFATLDIAGYNYAAGGDHGTKRLVERDHQRVPDRIIYSAESYPLEAFDSWMDVIDNPYVIGDFVWTGFDYLGEASIGWLGYPQDGNFYPWNHAYCGDIDICGFKRPQSYYRDVLWQHEKGYPVSVFVTPPEPSFDLFRERASWSKWHWHDQVADWNWSGHEGEPLEVTVYSMYPQVELFLNGESLGKKQTTRESKWTAVYQVPYASGELRATGYSEEVEKSSVALVTTGDPVRIVMAPDRSKIRADGQDLSFIVVELQDANGLRDPKAGDRINFEISGPGEIVATGSSNPMSVESFRQPHRKAYQGRCLVIVRAGTTGGDITLRASSGSLEPSEIIITSSTGK
jgi:beta-galactosidase